MNRKSKNLWRAGKTPCPVRCNSCPVLSCLGFYLSQSRPRDARFA